MKRLLLFLFVPFLAQAQPSAKRDSLLRIAREAPADSTRVQALMDAGKLYLDTQADTAAFYLRQGLALAERIGYERGIAKCRINLSYAANNAGHYRESVEYCKAAIPICTRLSMKKEKVAAYNNMGNALDFLGSRWLAIDAFSQALRAADEVALPPKFVLTVRGNLSKQYNDLGLFEKGIETARLNLQQAIDVGDSVMVAFALQDLVYPLSSLHQKAEALGYCRRIIAIARKEEQPRLLVFALNNSAVLVFDQDPSTATQMRLEALDIAQKNGDLFGEIGALQGLAKGSIYKKQYDIAQKYADQAMILAKNEHMDDEISNCFLIQSDLALATGNTDLYRQYRKQYNLMCDTLVNNSLIHATQDLQTKYETEKKEQQIAQLEQESELHKLRIARQKALLGGLGVFSILILVIGGLLIRNLRNRRRLAEQTLKIQEQQLIQLKQEQQLSVADAVLRSQEDERSRLARDLHDGLGGMLSGVKQSLNGMKGNQILTETAALAFGQVINDLDRSIGELRNIARNMMPEALVRFGLRDALHDYCDHLRLSSGLQVNFQAFGLDKRLPQQTEVLLFRIAQELLNNIVKHADASTVLVQLMEQDGRVSLTVEDNGKGFDPEKLKTVPGVGWLSIQSRVEYLKGTLDLRSKPGEGASVTVECDV